jgi:hypothetical protein
MFQFPDFFSNAYQDVHYLANDTGQIQPTSISIQSLNIDYSGLPYCKNIARQYIQCIEHSFLNKGNDSDCKQYLDKYTKCTK